MKKVPMRQCAGCGEMRSKKDLIRIIKTPEEDIVIDATGKKNGRGAYLCCSLDCFAKAVERKALDRSLKVTIPKEIYTGLEKELKELDTE